MQSELKPEICKQMQLPAPVRKHLVVVFLVIFDRVCLPRDLYSDCTE